MPSWIDAAEKIQQKLCDELGDRTWNSYTDSQTEYLRRNVAYALFGLPDNEKTGYSSEKLDDAKKMCRVIKEHGTNSNASNTMVSVIFVVFHNDAHDAVPEAVFRIPRFEDNRHIHGHIFIDRNRRIYRSWSDYKQNNKLPAGRFCYPVSGVYTRKKDGSVRTDFGPTPAATVLQEALRAADKAATIVAVSSGVVLVGAVLVGIPPVVVTTAQFAGAGAGVYGAGRGAMTLADRYNHEQEIGLGNSEALNAWLNIAGGILGVAGLRASYGTWSHVVVNGVRIASLTKNGLGVANLVLKLHAKYKKGKLTELDVFQFSASCLFFGMSAYTFKMAKARIIEGAQPDVGLVPLNEGIRTIETFVEPRSNVSAEDVTKFAKFLAVDLPKLINLFVGSDPILNNYHEGAGEGGAGEGRIDVAKLIFDIFQGD